MKRRTPAALYVGALPGAIPPVLGWAAATATVAPAAWALFATMFIWQIPHFLGLSLLLANDYRAAGVRAMPVVSGEAATRRAVCVGVALPLPVSLTLLPTGVAGPLYTLTAPLAGLVFIIVCFKKPPAGPAGYADWGRRVFRASLVHLTALFGALAIDALIR